ncbi:MAG: phage tail sheath subtilisin-like domain-containing protein [Smithella sp.]
MAILRGFPPSNTISPSVRITEKDLSFIAPEQSFHRAGLIGFASKGPINVPTLVSTQRQLNTVFGYPHPESGDPYLIYAAEQYLLVANELYIVRVADEDNVSDEKAETASVDVPSAGGRIVVMSQEQGPYTFVNDSFFRWRLNGVLMSKTLVVLAGTYTAAQLAEELNLQLDGQIDGIEFITDEGDDYIGVQTTWAYGPDSEFEFVSVQDAMYGGAVLDGNVTGFGTGMTQAEITGSNDRYPSSYQDAGEYDLAGLSDLNIQIVVDGTDNVLIDNVVQVIDLFALENSEVTTSQLVNAINAQLVENGGTLPGGWEAYDDGDNLAFRTKHHGRDARLLIKPDSTAAGIFGLVSVTKVGSSPVGTSGDPAEDTYGRINGDANSTGAITFTINADTAGIDGNATQVVVENNIREGNFILQIYNNGVEVESWGGLTKDENSRFYVETFLALVSDWIRISDNTSNSAPPLDGTYRLTGGSDGIPSDPDDQDALLIGNRIGFSGMYALSEPEQIDLDLIACPGHSSTSIVTALLDLCQNVRMDCLAIIDPPFGLTVKEIVQWQNGSHPLNTTRFDSDFGALYWPWVKIRDNFNRIDIWAPPSGSVMATIARSDQLSAPWFAPAGVNRGNVPNITDVFSRPTLEERDLMYGYRNAINPIVQFVDFEGFVIWGQKTLQRRPTALDRVNVRRLMFVIEKRIRAASRQLLFDPHDDILRQKFTRIATAILSEIQVGRGINDFRVKCDTELNTPDVIDRNEMRARIGVQPIRAAEFIFIEFSIHRTGSFGENADTF